MKVLKQSILDSDIFAHSTLNRYRGRQSYATLTGGTVSIALVLLFIGLFFNMMMDTFNHNIINAQMSTYIDDDPAHQSLITSSNNSFMFAVGLSGIDLSNKLRYFDIAFARRSTIKNQSGTHWIKEIINLQPCTEAHWNGISDSITNNYYILDFKKWLCPPIGTELSLQGKFTSTTFQFAEIKIGQCTESNPSFSGTNCRNSSEVANLLSSMGQFTFNYYYVNPVINPFEKDYLRYYLQDTNYFSFDTDIGISANLFFNQYTITTDSTMLAWKQESDVKGIKTEERAIGQTYRVDSSKLYCKFFLRKGPSRQVHNRSFQKLDETLSYIGGLFGTLTLLLTFLSLYSRYCYQLQMGDRIFKQNNGGSFGSQNFNFIVFIGYLLYQFFSKVGLYFNWTTMKKYHECRSECQKQLDIDLLFKKMTHFEQISKVILEDHQQQMLLMIPKPTIGEARVNRKRFLVKSILYHQLEKKAREIHLSEEIFDQKLREYLEKNSSNDGDEDQKEHHLNTLKMIQGDIAEGYKKAQKEDNPLSKKIIEKLAIKEIAEGLVNFFLKAQSQREEESVEEEPIKEEMINLGEEPEMTTHALFRGGKVANLNILERRPPKRESRNSGMELIDLAKIIKRASSRFK